MIVFDVDGTLIDGEQTDWKCFDEAFKEAAGFSLTSSFFESLKEVTAKSIVHQALDGATEKEKLAIEAKTRQGVVDRIRQAIENDPDAFPAREGAASVLQDLQQHGIPVAIATGDWRDSILVKLKASGIPFDNIPMVTSSDFYNRSEIIKAAVEKAGGHLSGSIYVGDGHWDLRATRKLGIAFIGTGSKLDKLREEGATYLLDRLSVSAFRKLMEDIKMPNR